MLGRLEGALRKRKKSAKAKTADSPEADAIGTNDRFLKKGVARSVKKEC